MEIDINRPRIVESHDVTLDAEYAEWIAEVKHSEIQMLENQYSIKLHQLGAELDDVKRLRTTSLSTCLNCKAN